MRGLTEITGDLYDIASRLKEIDCAYRLFYNRIKRRYEVYAGYPRPILQCVIPYSSLDCRAIRYVLRTRTERIRQLIEEIERDNLAREREEKIYIMRAAEKELEVQLKRG